MLYVDCFCSLNFISEVAEKKARWVFRTFFLFPVGLYFCLIDPFEFWCIGFLGPQNWVLIFCINFSVVYCSWGSLGCVYRPYSCAQFSDFDHNGYPLIHFEGLITCCICDRIFNLALGYPWILYHPRASLNEFMYLFGKIKRIYICF